jgi:hypothetical protein
MRRYKRFLCGGLSFPFLDAFPGSHADVIVLVHLLCLFSFHELVLPRSVLYMPHDYVFLCSCL